MRLNSLEEWTIVNTTDEWHTFHIHINPYQVTKINGKPVKGITWDDNVVVGPYGGSVTMRTRFTDFTGQVRHPLPRPLPRGPRHDERRAGGAQLTAAPGGPG